MSRLSIRRLKTILKRQDPSGWDANYQPAQQVKRGEAPGSSRPSLIWSASLGRQMHLMSGPEQIVAIIVQYSKAAYEIREQHMLPMTPTVHPLHSDFHALGVPAPWTRGTLHIASELGCLDQHPLVYEKSGQPKPYPLLGDFLIFCRDELGPFCVDISVKRTMSDFYTKHGAIFTTGRKYERDCVKEINRHQIQQVLNDQLGIRMIYAAGDSIDKRLRYNLTHLYKWHARPVGVTDETRSHLVSIFNDCVASQVPPQEIFPAVSRIYGCSQYEFNAVFFQAVWRREITPDLYSCLQINRPMQPESRNLLVEYSEWFTRA